MKLRASFPTVLLVGCFGITVGQFQFPQPLRGLGGGLGGGQGQGWFPQFPNNNGNYAPPPPLGGGGVGEPQRPQTPFIALMQQLSNLSSVFAGRLGVLANTTQNQALGEERRPSYYGGFRPRPQGGIFSNRIPLRGGNNNNTGDASDLGLSGPSPPSQPLFNFLFSNAGSNLFGRLFNSNPNNRVTGNFAQSWTNLLSAGGGGGGGNNPLFGGLGGLGGGGGGNNPLFGGLGGLGGGGNSNPLRALGNLGGRRGPNSGNSNNNRPASGTGTGSGGPRGTLSIAVPTTQAPAPPAS